METEETPFRDLVALQPIVDIINRNLTPSHRVLKAEAVDEGSHGIWLTTNIKGLVIFWGQNADTWGAGIDKDDGHGWEEQIESVCPFTAGDEETAIAILTESEKWLAANHGTSGGTSLATS